MQTEKKSTETTVAITLRFVWKLNPGPLGKQFNVLLPKLLGECCQQCQMTNENFFQTWQFQKMMAFKSFFMKM